MTEKMPKQTLRESELRYRRLFESAQDGILILDAKTGMIEDVNPFLVKMLGYSREEFIDKKIWEVGAFRDIEANKEAFRELVDKDYIRYDDLPLKTIDGRLKQVEFVSNVYQVNNEKVIQCNIRDISERKQAEAKILETDFILSQSQRLAHIGSWGWDMVGPLQWSDETYRIYGISPETNTLTPETMIRLIHPDDRPAIQKWFDACKSGISPDFLEYRTILPDGTIRFINGSGVLLYDKAGKPSYITGTVQDVTERKHFELKIQSQFEHLKALSIIDHIISSNFDLKVSLSEIIIHVKEELNVDAATILLLNPTSLMLEHGADVGFKSKSVKKTQIRLGESFAGMVAYKLQNILIPNLQDDPKNKLLTQLLLTGEDFKGYYGVPLLIKGQVKGVLEIFNRETLKPDDEWINFLNSLARQIAIAIENASLLERLQRSNLELQLAYDATIEGWSRALDMRDEETKGHSLRVTDMAVKLAGFFGLNETEILNIRRGALLHDIGKMGIPDQILLKPAPLTDDEWLVMRKHPTFAYDLLSPIIYLQQALEIPYCHHEKWDGTGYPQGLKDTHIPLAARIFSVVDVWDALNSDRPYRLAWSPDKIIEHIKGLSGIQFDPRVVDSFLLMQKE
jgi:PAS domain S-box-containing protein